MQSVRPVKNDNTDGIKWRWDRYGEISMFHFRQCYNFILLNQSAALIWFLSDGSRTLKDISGELRRLYGGSDEKAWYPRTRRALLRLKGLGLVSFSKDRQERSADIKEALKYIKGDKSPCRPLITESDGAGFMFRHGTRPDMPLQAYLVITHECNLRCKHCYERAHSDRTSLKTEDVKRIMDLLAEAGIFCLGITGGEPFLRKDIYEIIDYGTEKGFYIRINTNGTLLDREAVRRLKKYKGRLSLYIGLDGGSAETHDFNRGRGSFESTVANMKSLIGEGMDVFADHTVNRYNSKDLFRTYFLCNRLRVNAVNISEFSPLGFGETNKGELFLSALPYRLHLYSLKAMLFFVRALRRKSIRTRLITFFNKRCPAGTMHFVIYPTRGAAICELMSCCFGDVSGRHPSELWHSKELLRLLDANNFGVPCSICLFRYTCNGKCRAYVSEMTGNAFSGNSFCMRGRLFRLINGLYVARTALGFLNSAIDRHYNKKVRTYAPYKERELSRRT